MIDIMALLILFEHCKVKKDIVATSPTYRVICDNEKIKKEINK